MSAFKLKLPAAVLFGLICLQELHGYAVRPRSLFHSPLHAPLRTRGFGVSPEAGPRPGKLFAQNNFFEKVRESLDQPLPAVVKAVDKAGGRVTAADVARLSGTDLREAKKSLTALATLTQGALEVSEDGDIVYNFGRNVEGQLSASSRVAAAQRTFREKVFPVLFYLVRVGFGVSLVVSVVIVYAAILAASSQRSDEERRDYGGPNFYFGPSIFDLFWYRPYYGYYYGPDYRWSAGPAPRPELGFFESIFSFIFGDGNPNNGMEREQLRLCAKTIRENGGAVTAEQLAPFLDISDDYVRQTNDALGGEGSAYDVDESFMLPILTALRGEAVVTEDGDIVYVFPELSATTAEIDASAALPSRPYPNLSELQLQMLDEASTSELLAIGEQLGLNTRVFSEKRELKEAVMATLDDRSAPRSGGFLNMFSKKEERPANVDVIQEKEIAFSEANFGQKLLAGGLAIANLAGVFYLQGIVASIPAGYKAVGILGFAANLLPFLIPYAVALNAIPIIRYFKNQRDNAGIQKRNGARQRMRALLRTATSPVSRLSKKIAAAKAEAKNRGAEKRVLKGDDMGYTSAMSLSEQTDPFFEFDRRLQDKATRA